jgi:hypothetical protein
LSLRISLRPSPGFREAFRHDFEEMSIEALAELRDAVTAATRQRELQQEADRIGELVEGRARPPTVFFRDDLPWVPSFIEKNRHYRVDCTETEFVAGGRKGIWFRQDIVAYRQD